MAVAELWTDNASTIKITLRIFAVICVLWAVLVALLPVKPPPKLESNMQQAVSDAHKILDSHAGPIDMNTESMKTNEVPSPERNLDVFSERLHIGGEGGDHSRTTRCATVLAAASSARPGTKTSPPQRGVIRLK